MTMHVPTILDASVSFSVSLYAVLLSFAPEPRQKLEWREGCASGEYVVHWLDNNYGRNLVHN